MCVAAGLRCEGGLRHQYDFFAHSFPQDSNSAQGVRAGFRPADNLQPLHLVDWSNQTHTYTFIRTVSNTRKLRDAKGGSAGHQNCRGTADFVEQNKYFAFRFELFRHRFDYQVRLASRLLERSGILQSSKCRGRISRRNLAQRTA